MLRAVGRRERDVTRMNEVGDELAVKLDNFNGKSEEARLDQKTTNDRYQRVCIELRNRRQFIEARVNAADKFTSALQELESELTSVDAAILDEPVGSKSDVLKRQLAELQVCLWFSCFCVLVLNTN